MLVHRKPMFDMDLSIGSRGSGANPRIRGIRVFVGRFVLCMSIHHQCQERPRGEMRKMQFPSESLGKYYTNLTPMVLGSKHFFLIVFFFCGWLML